MAHVQCGVCHSALVLSSLSQMQFFKNFSLSTSSTVLIVDMSPDKVVSVWGKGREGRGGVVVQRENCGCVILSPPLPSHPLLIGAQIPAC